MPSSDPVQRFSDIIENIEAVERFTAGMELQGFAVADQTIRAVKYSLLIISEAAAKLGGLAGDLCPSIPWREIRGLGNRLRHDYESIDVIRIWLLIEQDLPPAESRQPGCASPAGRKPAGMRIGYTRLLGDKRHDLHHSRLPWPQSLPRRPGARSARGALSPA